MIEEKIRENLLEKYPNADSVEITQSEIKEDLFFAYVHFFDDWDVDYLVLYDVKCGWLYFYKFDGEEKIGDD